MRTPKEKAKQLVLIMYNNIGLNAKTSHDQCLFEAKKCAIVTVDFIINEWNNYEVDRTSKQTYWMEVRNEVERYTSDTI